MIRGIHHTSFTVGDMDAQAAFYRDVLGAEIVWDSKQAGVEFKGELADNVTNCPGTEQRLAFLRVGESLLEFVEYTPTGKAQADNKASDTGVCHVCFRTTDIHAFYSNLKDHGVTTHCEPQHFGDDWCFYFRDPEGNVLEAIQGDSVLGIS